MRDKGERERESYGSCGSKYVVGQCEAVYMEGDEESL